MIIFRCESIVIIFFDQLELDQLELHSSNLQINDACVTTYPVLQLFPIFPTYYGPNYFN